jgi:hypothetical protein
VLGRRPLPERAEPGPHHPAQCRFGGLQHGPDLGLWRFFVTNDTITDAARDDLKVELAVLDADERFCFGRLRVLTEGDPLP